MLTGLGQAQNIWFQGGPGGVVFWSFSTKAIDVEDVFTNPDVQRTTVVVELGSLTLEDPPQVPRAELGLAHTLRLALGQLA